MASLLSLPTELRLHIFSQVFSMNAPHISSDEDLPNESLERIRHQKDTDTRFIANARPHTLFIRNLDPLVFRTIATLTWPCWRTVYEVRCDRFRARVLDTTYQCMNLNSFGGDIRLLLVNHQLHVEAARLFYGGYTFDFDTHIEAIVPFFADITPFSRSCIRSIALTKRALPYDKEYDRCEWSNTMHYLSNPQHGIALQCIHLDIIAGKPGEHGWDDVSPFVFADFHVLVHTYSMSWLKDLIKIKAAEVNIRAIVEHCPPASSSDAMADYIRFSASIDDGLTAFVKSAMSPS
ncbi:hypothetical protein AMS68_000650 [Peltaster fructicola]|uniref:F-box domain-containing protein n=1 Tax=Peltaster fructicola TaxID=286661 RepID=A0A6H0XK73_9PEZI|nr:hypothetical protein AMS68_000650 [Peltaster fructicola]